MDAKALIRQLQQYGLDDGEATLYYTLSRLGPSRAAAIAEAAGRKRTDAYRILDHLAAKNFVQKTLERPARYIPRPLEEALARAMAARDSQTKAMEAHQRDLVQAWPKSVSVANPNQARFSIHQGPSQIMGLLLRMIESAREEILLAASKDGLARLDAPALNAALAARAAEGIVVRVLSKHARGSEQPFPTTDGVRLRYGELPTFYQSLIIDEREICLFVSSGKGLSGTEDGVLRLNSSDLVLAQKALFDQAWSTGFAEADLEDEGPPRQVKVLRGRWVRGARLREMILAATESIEIQASAEEASHWRSAGIEAALAQQGKKGRRITLRVPGLSGQAPHGAIVAIPKDSSCPLYAVIDGRQALLGLDTPGAQDGSPPEDEWAIWSTHPGLVRNLAALTAAGKVVRQPLTD